MNHAPYYVNYVRPTRRTNQQTDMRVHREATLSILNTCMPLPNWIDALVVCPDEILTQLLWTNECQHVGN